MQNIIIEADKLATEIYKATGNSEQYKKALELLDSLIEYEAVSNDNWSDSEISKM